MQQIEMLKCIMIQGWNHTILYIESIIFYLGDTAFFLPLENIMICD
jgi:hypothetical protein